MLVAAETREVFQGLGPGAEGFFYLLAFVATAVFAWGWIRRVRKYRQGRAADRVRLRGSNRKFGGQSLVDSLYAMMSNRTVRRRDRSAGVAHFLVFWGFITLFIGTVVLTIDADIVRNATRLIGGEERSFFRGLFYIVYSF